MKGRSSHGGRSEQGSVTVTEGGCWQAKFLQDRQVQVAQGDGAVITGKVLSGWNQVWPTGQQDGQIVGIMLISVRHARAKQDDAAIQQAVFSLTNFAQTFHKPCELLHIPLIDFLILCDF